MHVQGGWGLNEGPNQGVPGQGFGGVGNSDYQMRQSMNDWNTNDGALGSSRRAE